MKPWTADLLIGVITIVGISTIVAVTQPTPVLLAFLAGAAAGYGLRIGITNQWPHIFRPRIAFQGEAKDIGDT